MDKVDKGRGIYKQRSARHRRADGEPDRCAVNPLMHWRTVIRARLPDAVIWKRVRRSHGCPALFGELVFMNA